MGPSWVTRREAEKFMNALYSYSMDSEEYGPGYQIDDVVRNAVEAAYDEDKRLRGDLSPADAPVGAGAMNQPKVQRPKKTIQHRHT